MAVWKPGSRRSWLSGSPGGSRPFPGWAWGTRRRPDTIDPNDRVESTPRLRVAATDHPAGFGVILRDFRVVRVRDAGRIRKTGAYYVLDPE